MAQLHELKKNRKYADAHPCSPESSFKSDGETSGPPYYVITINIAKIISRKSWPHHLEMFADSYFCFSNDEAGLQVQKPTM